MGVLDYLSDVGSGFLRLQNRRRITWHSSAPRKLLNRGSLGEPREPCEISVVSFSLLAFPAFQPTYGKPWAWFMVFASEPAHGIGNPRSIESRVAFPDTQTRTRAGSVACALPNVNEREPFFFFLSLCGPCSPRSPASSACQDVVPLRGAASRDSRVIG
mgnify:CR=1 FL=1